MGHTIRKKGDNRGGAIGKIRSSIARDLIVTIISIVEPKIGRSTYYWIGCNDATRRKTGQRRESLLNRIETFLWECGSVGKASIRWVGNTIREKGDNSGGAIRKIRNSNRIATELLVTIINIVEPKNGRSTYYWSGSNDGSRGNGSKGCETHIGEDLE